ncbi:hypothetical protein Tco_0798791, partial [Tanacetum coccineum]
MRLIRGIGMLKRLRVHTTPNRRSKSSSPFRDHKSVTDDIDITPKDDEGDASNSGLRSMPDDDLTSLTGFETQDSSDHFSDAGTETLYASTDKPAQSDPLGHLHEELCLLNNK